MKQQQYYNRAECCKGHFTPFNVQKKISSFILELGLLESVETDALSPPLWYRKTEDCFMLDIDCVCTPQLPQNFCTPQLPQNYVRNLCLLCFNNVLTSTFVLHGRFMKLESE